MKTIFYIGNFDLSKDSAALIRVTNNLMLLDDKNVNKVIFGFNLSDDIEKKYKHITFISHTKPTNLIKWFKYTNFINNSIKKYQAKEEVIILYNSPTIVMLQILKNNKSYIIGDITEWYQFNELSVKNIIKKIDNSLRMRILNKRLNGLILVSSYLFNYYKNIDNKVIIPTLVNDTKKNKEYVNNKKTKVIYSGIPENKDKLKDFIDAFKKYVKNHDDNIVLNIYGITLDDYVSQFNDKTVTNIKEITYHGYQNNKIILDATRNSNFGFLLRESNIRNNAGFPTKFSEYMTLGLPIIYNEFSDISSYINKKSIKIKHIDEDSIYNALIKMNMQDLNEHNPSDKLTTTNHTFKKRFEFIVNNQHNKEKQPYE